MEIQKKPPFELTETQEDYVEVENQCCLCGSQLSFAFEPDYPNQTLTEKAHCTTCGVELKEKKHTIH